jgi:hypothetical protein
MSHLMSAYGIPGGSVAVSRDGRILHAKGFGYANLDSAVMVDTRHRFRIASISKPIYYTTPEENITVSTFDGSTWVPWPYGGFAIESMDALGGWIASPSDLLRFLTVAPADFGWFNGSLPGSIGSLSKEANGFGWAILFNRPPEDWEALHKEMHALMTRALSTR